TPQPPEGGALEPKKNKAVELLDTSSKVSSFGEPVPKFREDLEEALEGASYSRQLMCEDTGLSYEEPSPNSFSFNSPYGACPTCKGLGNIFTIDIDLVLPDKT